MLSQQSRVSALNKTGLDAWLQAAQVIAEGTEKFGRLQFEALKYMFRGTAERGFELKNFTELHGQASTATAAAAEKCSAIRDGCMTPPMQRAFSCSGSLRAARLNCARNGLPHWKMSSRPTPGGKTGGTKAALDTTRATMDAMAEGFTRTAKQSIELADAVVKTTSDSAAQALKAIAPRG